MEKPENMKKFMMSVGDLTLQQLEKEAKSRDISVQELVRVEIIPMWLKSREKNET